MSLPLHPLMVHLPLALSLLMPLFAIAGAWAICTGRLGRRSWLAVAVLQVMLVASALLAMNSGEREEDRVEAVVPAAALHQHEAYAEQFVWGAAIVLGLTLVVFVPAVTRSFAVVTIVGTIAVAGLALRVGHAGGQLVYVHNAGAAYRATGAVTAQSPTAGKAGVSVASRQAPDRADHEDDEN